MKDTKPHVDKNLIEMFLKILTDKLQKPEEWKTEGHPSDYKYSSTYINPTTKTYFVTMGVESDGTVRADSVLIRKGDYDNVYEIKVNYRNRKSIRKLYGYMKLKKEWSEFEKIDKVLKESLPENMDRYLKLSKIRKNL